MKKLNKSWWGMIAFLVFLEALVPFRLDYWHDPMVSIICIHAFPVIAIVIILIFGPSKEK